MSARGQSIAAYSPPSSPPQPPRPWRMETAARYVVLGNLVAIAAFLTAAPRAYAEGPAAHTAATTATKLVPVFVTRGEMRSGALLLKSESAALASEASGQRGHPNMRAPDTR